MKEKIILVTMFLGSIFLFALLDVSKSKRYNFSNRADHFIPFSAWFVIPYIALFPFILFTAFALFKSVWVSEYFLSMAIAMYSAVLIWWLIPAGTERPKLSGHGPLEKMVLWIYKHDQRRHAFPSSHVFTAIISAFYLSLAFPAHILLWSLMGGLIAISTLFMKQHYVVDVLVGIFWSASSIFLAEFVLTLIG